MRLVGLKCMEARGLLFVDGEPTEVITTRAEYGGLSRLLWQMRAAGDDPGDEACLWRAGLERAVRAAAVESPALFASEHPLDTLWPAHAVLRETIASINTT